MKPDVNWTPVTAVGADDVIPFTFSKENEPLLMEMLRNTMYSNKILAVLREYGANARDAHVMAGKPDLPFKVLLPTIIGPYLVIRDFGPGLSREGVEMLFSYLDSTKRDDDRAIGSFGIGAKSGHAYADNFTITSWHGGVKASYAAIIAEDGRGMALVVGQEPCSEDETGLEVKIAVRNEDLARFRDEAFGLYRWFTPKPDCNFEIPDPPARTDSVCGTHDGRWTAIMGCVPYGLDLTQVDLGDAELDHLAKSRSGFLFFSIGEISVASSRETVELSRKSKAAIRTKMERLRQEEHSKLRATVLTLSAFERLRYIRDWARRTGFRPPDDIWVANWSKSSVLNPEILLVRAPETFTLQAVRRAWTNEKRVLEWFSPWSSQPVLKLNDLVKFVILDMAPKRFLKSYSISDSEVFVVPTGRNTLASVEEELGSILKESGIEGVPVVRASSLPLTVYSTKRKSGVVNIKHKHADFVLGVGPEYVGSKNWAISDGAGFDQERDLKLRVFRFMPPDIDTANAFTFYQRLMAARTEIRKFLPGFEIFGSKTDGLSWGEAKKALASKIPVDILSRVENYPWVVQGRCWVQEAWLPALPQPLQDDLAKVLTLTREAQPGDSNLWLVLHWPAEAKQASKVLTGLHKHLCNKIPFLSHVSPAYWSRYDVQEFISWKLSQGAK